MNIKKKFKNSKGGKTIRQILSNFPITRTNHSRSSTSSGIAERKCLAVNSKSVETGLVMRRLLIVYINDNGGVLL